jgi:DNA-binding transcriptional LysR family regulator
MCFAGQDEPWMLLNKAPPNESTIHILRIIGGRTDRLVSITAFVRVAESGGFTAAARRLNASTAAVSENVQALENTLGVRLLNRTTRRVSLTEIGRDYYERCVQILHDLEEADETAGALQLTPRGRLRLHCHHAI